MALLQIQLQWFQKFTRLQLPVPIVFCNESLSMPLFSQQPTRSIGRWLKSTSRRTFVVYLLCIIALQLLIHRGDLQFVIWGVPLLVWG